MAGDETDTGPAYSSLVGSLFVFNLIVGAGALALPQAVQATGSLVGVLTLAFLAFVSFVTVTFVNEAMAGVNALLRFDTRRRSSRVARVMGAWSERTPLLAGYDANGLDEALQIAVPPDDFDISQRVELGFMARYLWPAWAVMLFNLTITMYLYGDLAIYAMTVPHTIMTVACLNTSHSQYANASDGGRHNGTAELACLGGMFDQVTTYYLFVGIFAVVLGPLCFFNVQKTKYLQMATTLARWFAFIAMIGIASFHSSGDTHVDFRVLNLPTLLGVALYSFMCHHSLPSLVTPFRSKRHLTAALAAVFVVIFAFYAVLCYTAIRAYGGDIRSVYTENFAPLVPMGTILSLFPVFTLSSSFPIIAISLRNNLKALLLGRASAEGASDSRVDDAVAIKSVNADPHGAIAAGRQKAATSWCPSRAWLVDRIVIPLLAILPPIGVAFATSDVTTTVSITGAYPGVGIQYIIPTLLVVSVRQRVDRVLCGGPGRLGRLRNVRVNKHVSPFRSSVWVVLVLLWSLTCIALTTYRLLQKYIL